jgi:hypothetical protein
MVPFGGGKSSARAGANHAPNPILERVGAEPLNPAPGAEEGSLYISSGI